MPLQHSSSPQAFKANVRTLMGEIGKSPHVQSRAQALKIAYETKRRAGHKRGGEVKGYDAGGRTDAVNAVINALQAGSGQSTGGGDGSNPNMTAPTTGLPTLPTSPNPVMGPQSPPNTGPNVGLPLLPSQPLGDATSPNPNSQLPPQGLPGASNVTSALPFNTGVGSGGGLQYPGVPNPASRGGMHRGGLAHLAMGGVGVQPTPWFVRNEAHNLLHTGPVMSAVPGRTDRHNVSVPSSSYVFPSDFVSHLGQNNSQAGMKILSNMGFGSGGPPTGAKMPRGPGLPRAPRLMGIPGDAGGSRGQGKIGIPTPVVIAGGEFVAPPGAIMRVLKTTDMKHAHKVLDSWVMQVRKDHIKTLRSLPPPAKA